MADEHRESEFKEEEEREVCTEGSCVTSSNIPLKSDLQKKGNHPSRALNAGC
jgi:hypothetical protein